MQRPTLQELVKRVQTDIISKSGVYASSLKKTFIKAYSYAIAGVTHSLYGYLEFIFQEAFATTCSESTLYVWAYIYGVPRKQATFALRKIALIGTSGSVLLSGTRYRSADGIEFETQTEILIGVGGTGEVLVRSLTAGTTGNIADGEKVNLLSPVSGIQSSATILSAGAINGEDQETVEYWRERIISKIQKPPHGGNEADYENWALEIPGVTRVWVYPKYLGIGTVGLAFVNDAEADIFPIPAKVAEVQAALDVLRPVTAELFVFAPVQYPINFTIQLYPNSQAVRDAVTAALKDLVKSEGEPGGKILLSHVNEAISLAVGEYDHALVTPSANVQAPSGNLPVVGTITFQEIP